jgi:hypothetical protein
MICITHYQFSLLHLRNNYVLHLSEEHAVAQFVEALRYKREFDF